MSNLFLTVAFAFDVETNVEPHAHSSTINRNRSSASSQCFEIESSARLACSSCWLFEFPDPLAALPEVIDHSRGGEYAQVFRHDLTRHLGTLGQLRDRERPFIGEAGHDTQARGVDEGGEDRGGLLERGVTASR